MNIPEILNSKYLKLCKYYKGEKNNPYKESEKYLYYVACTRAQHNLVVYNEPKALKKGMN